MKLVRERKGSKLKYSTISQILIIIYIIYSILLFNLTLFFLMRRDLSDDPLLSIRSGLIYLPSPDIH